MAAVQTRAKKVGNLVKKEFWPDEMWCRKEITLTYANIANREVGTVVVDDGATGTFAAVPIDATIILPADPVAIVIDPDFADLVAADLAGPVAGTVSVVAMFRGPAVIRKGALSYGDLTNPLNAAIVRTTLGTNDIDLVDQFSVATQS